MTEAPPMSTVLSDIVVIQGERRDVLKMHRMVCISILLTALIVSCARMQLEIARRATLSKQLSIFIFLQNSLLKWEEAVVIPILSGFGHQLVVGGPVPQIGKETQLYILELPSQLQRFHTITRAETRYVIRRVYPRMYYADLLYSTYNIRIWSILWPDSISKVFSILIFSRKPTSGNML